MGLISLSGMEFFAYHGCFAEEQIIGNKFIVDLEFFSSTDKAETTDDLSATVNYQKVYEMVKAEMEIKSKLLEHVAYRIQRSLYANFPYIGSSKITVSKLNPPIGGKVEKVSVVLTKQN
jgi:7,8-dihydroneopterin aldolase/epimerase/oxygenase